MGKGVLVVVGGRLRRGRRDWLKREAFKEVTTWSYIIVHQTIGVHLAIQPTIRAQHDVLNQLTTDTHAEVERKRYQGKHQELLK